MTYATDLAILTAVHGAFAVCENQWWMFGGEYPGDERAKCAPTIVAEMAGFVRLYGREPPEALWNVAKGVAAKKAIMPLWRELSPEIQYAFDIFANVILRVDKTAADATIAEEMKAAQKKPPPPHDIEGTPLEQTRGLLDPL